MDYTVIWEGVEYENTSYQESILDTSTVTNLAFTLDHHLKGRFQVTFFEKDYYELALIFNYTAIEEMEDITERTRKLQLIESKSVLFFESISADYGVFGVERSATHLKEAVYVDALVEYNRAYFSKKWINASSVLRQLVHQAGYQHEAKQGIYIRFDPIDGYVYREHSMAQSALAKSLSVHV